MMKLIATASVATVVLASASARADFVTFDLTWSGAGFGNSATATGSVTIDTSSGVFDSVGVLNLYDTFAGSPFSDFTITVVGATSGNGAFSSANGDFDHVSFYAFGPLDINIDLVGQANFLDFNVFTSGMDAPDGSDPSQIRTNGGSGDIMRLTSMVAQDVSVVPLPPAAWAGLGLLGAMGAARRLRR